MEISKNIFDFFRSFDWKL